MKKNIIVMNFFNCDSQGALGIWYKKLFFSKYLMRIFFMLFFL